LSRKLLMFGKIGNAACANLASDPSSATLLGVSDLKASLRKRSRWPCGRDEIGLLESRTPKFKVKDPESQIQKMFLRLGW